MAFLRAEHLCKDYISESGSVSALSDISFDVEKGEIFGIIGLSGAGKSTLVRCINRLEEPTSGCVYIQDRNINELSPKELRNERRNIGMIFQHFNLLMQRSVLDNVALPLEIAGVKKKEARERAKEYLEAVGIPDKISAYPSQLLGGQKQRVAIARVLASDPELLLCDEATSALDPQTTRQILALLRDINRKYGITIIIITHAMTVVQEICDRVAVLENGKLVEMNTVKELFAHPQTKAAKRLLLIQDDDDETEETDEVKEVLAS